MPTSPGQPDQVSNLKLKASYWYVTHKPQLRVGLIIFLIALSIFLYGYSLYRTVIIMVMQQRSFQQQLSGLSANLINYSYFNEVNKPKALAISGFDVAGGQNNRYDFIAKISNPNAQYAAAAVQAELVLGEQVIAQKQTFFLPGEEKYVIFFGQEVEDPGSAIIKIASVSWHRFNGYPAYAATHWQFKTSDIKFTPANQSGIRGELPVSVLNLKITNNSAYSFWSVGLYLILFNGDQIVGANYTTLDQFKSGETRDVEMRWYESLPVVSNVLVVPEVNILDQSAYMPVQ